MGNYKILTFQDFSSILSFVLNTPEQVLVTAYQDGLQIATERGFEPVTQYDRASSTLDLELSEMRHRVLIDQGDVYSHPEQGIVGFVMTRVSRPRGFDFTPSLRVGFRPHSPETEKNKTEQTRIALLADRSPWRENALGDWGGWLEIFQDQNDARLSVAGTSLVDIIPDLRGFPYRRLWLQEEIGREFLKAVIEDSFDHFARYHRFKSFHSNKLATAR